MTPFDHQPRTRLVFGVGAVREIAGVVKELGARRVLLVTDPGIVAAGHAALVRGLLCDAGLRVDVFDRVQQNPTTRCVEDCVASARAAGADLLLGLGGGSAMDTAKGCNFLLTNGGRMQDYWGVGKARHPMLPLVAVPTTAGTGSECQSAALIADAETHQKMACLDPKAAARVAILDPALTLSLPPMVTSHTGVDAIVHALETAVTRRRNPWSVMLSHQAFKLLVSGLPRVLREPTDLEARGAMLLGAALAGMAIEASMLGAAHAAANPLTAHHGVLHGVAVGLMTPAVVRFNAVDPEARRAYADLACAAGVVPAGASASDAIEALVGRLEWLWNLATIPRSLAEVGVEPQQLDRLAAEASQQWTARFNPREIAQDGFLDLYRSAMTRRGEGVGVCEGG